MPGPQPRRAFQQRLGSAARRGAYAPPGVPGVYRVPRRVVSAIVADAGLSGSAADEWIQGPDYTFTRAFAAHPGWEYGLEGDEGTADTVHLANVRDGVSLDGAPVVGTVSAGQATFRLQISTQGTDVDELVSYSVAQQAMSVAGGILTSLFYGESDGAYTPPTPPPGGYTVEYEAGAGNGTLVGDATIAGNFQAGGEDDGAIEWNPGGSLYWTSAEDNETHHTAAHIINNYEWMFSTGEQASTPFTQTIPVEDIFGTTSAAQQAAEMFLHPIAGGMTDTGSAGRSTSYSVVLSSEGTVGGAEITVTVRPPRHRFVPPASSGGWTVSPNWSAYVADIGLYLGSAFEDMAGHPATLPTGCAELHYYVAPASADVVAKDFTQPYGDYYIGSGYDGNDIQPPASTPDAGSHLWVIWFGPGFDWSTDPEPGVTPESLVPASLAENGTG